MLRHPFQFSQDLLGVEVVLNKCIEAHFLSTASFNSHNAIFEIHLYLNLNYHSRILYFLTVFEEKTCIFLSKL